MTRNASFSEFHTPLFDEHLKLNAKVVPFAGWMMPVQYEKGIIAEHLHTRKFVSLFDICHMGEILLQGDDITDALEIFLPRPVKNMKQGVCRYNFLLSEMGTLLDDMLVYKYNDKKYLLVLNAARKKDDLNYLKQQLPHSVKISDMSSSTAKLDLQGPHSAKILNSAGVSLLDLPGYYHFTELNINGINVLLSRTGYTGELGFELYFNSEDAVDMWNYLLTFPNVEPAGLGARDTLRIEMGYPLYGHEMNENTTPLEAGFEHLIDLNAKRTFVGKKSLLENEKKKKIIGILFHTRRACRHGAEIRLNGNAIGCVASGTFSPSLSQSLAMGYVDSNVRIETGSELEVDTGRAFLKGVVTDLPFYKNGTVKKIIESEQI